MSTHLQKDFSSDEKIKVILVDRTDQFLGESYKLLAHERGYLHRAFSAILYNPQGEMLIQRRALGKYHSPSLWANSCCGHPFVDEPVKEAARRRLQEELGVICDLNFRTNILYFLKLDHQMREHEYVHVFEGFLSSEACCHLNSEEVMELKWIYPDQALAEVKKYPHLYTRWFRLYLLKYFDKLFQKK